MTSFKKLKMINYLFVIQRENRRANHQENQVDATGELLDVSSIHRTFRQRALHKQTAMLQTMLQTMWLREDQAVSQVHNSTRFVP